MPFHADFEKSPLSEEVRMMLDRIAQQAGIPQQVFQPDQIATHYSSTLQPYHEWIQSRRVVFTDKPF